MNIGKLQFAGITELPESQASSEVSTIVENMKLSDESRTTQKQLEKQKFFLNRGNEIHEKGKENLRFSY